MDLQKYRAHGPGRQPPALPFVGKGRRVMSADRIFLLWLAGILLGAVITLIFWDLADSRGSRLAWNIVPPLLIFVSLAIAFNAVYWAPRFEGRSDSEEDSDSLSFR